jgi:KDO2-lipid IV(A) lauroyltransferase
MSPLRSTLDYSAYLAIRAAMAAAGAVPLDTAAAAARAAARTYARLPLNRKRVARARGNLAVAFPEWDESRLSDVAVHSYEHLFELGLELILAPRLLNDDAWHRHVRPGSISPVVRKLLEGGPCLLLTGHCGNWELLGFIIALLGFPMHALYRPLDLKPLDRWVRDARERRGLTLVDKFGALRRLPALATAGVPLGFVADQNGGDRGVFVPFFNRLASSYKSIGLLALQFNMPLLCGVAHRVPPHERAPGRLGYMFEVNDAFGPEEWNSHPDPLFYLTARYRRAIELMVRKAPEQYLWMHRIWRSRPRHERLHRPFPAALEEKIRLLPWITDADVEAIKAHSERDARTLAETGQDKLS